MINNDTIKANIEDAHNLIKKAMALLVLPISATPSGVLRNHMTDINLHIMAADSACVAVRDQLT
jgi:hypothetical protein